MIRKEHRQSIGEASAIIAVLVGAPMAAFGIVAYGGVVGVYGMIIAATGVVIANFIDVTDRTLAQGEADYRDCLTLIYDGDVPPTLEDE